MTFELDIKAGFVMTCYLLVIIMPLLKAIWEGGAEND